MEEEKELPTVTGCTSLTLVDAVPSQPTSLLNKKQDLGDEATISHESHISAPLVAIGFENAVTQIEEPVEHGQPASLLSEKQDLGVEPKVSHDGTGSLSSAPELETLVTGNVPLSIDIAGKDKLNINIVLQEC